MILLCDFMEIQVFSHLEKVLLKEYIEELIIQSQSININPRLGFVMENNTEVLEETTLYQIT